MHNCARVICPALFCLALFFGAAQARGQNFIIDGVVVAVESGDSISVRNRRKILHHVRLAGVDAPETGQPFSSEARSYLTGLISGKTVKIIGRRFDDDGIFKGKVLLAGRDMNLEMVVAGLAWHHITVPGEQTKPDRLLYEAAESHARKAGFNLWATERPVPPWEYRGDRPPRDD